MILKSQNSKRKINRRYLAPPFLSQIVTRLRAFEYSTIEQERSDSSQAA
jgi:hypothetical protein